jgi:chromosome segregation ATPase/Tfp pilus assembly protein PilF
MIYQQAEEEEKAGSDLQALSKYRESQRLFDYISRTHPAWRQQMVNVRRRSILEAVDRVQGRLRSKDPAALQAWEAQNRGTGQPQAAPGAPGQVVAAPSEILAVVPPAPAPPAAIAVPPPPAPLAVAPPPAITDLPSEFQQQQARIDQLTGANARLEQTIRSHQQQTQSLQSQLAQARAAEQKLQAQLVQTMEELKQAKAVGGDQVRKLESQLAVAVEELRKANEDSAGILKALDEARRQVAELAAQKNDLLKDRQSTMEEVARTVAQANQAETDRDNARAERDKAKTERDEARQALEAARAELARLESMGTTSPEQAAALEAAREETEHLRTRVAALEQAAERDAAALQERDKLVQALRAELEGTGELPEQNAKLIAELEKSQESIRRLNEQVSRLEQDRMRLEQENRLLARDRDDLLAQRDRLQQDLDEMAILLNASDQIDGDIKDILKANQRWRVALDEARAEIGEMAKREGGYQQEIASLKRELTAIQEERDSLQAANAKYQQTVDELNVRLKEMLVQLDSKAGEIAALTKERDGLKGLLSQKDTLLARITGQLEQAKAETAALSHAKEENELLRSMIRRQLVRQAKLLQARDLVLAELRKVDVHSDQLLAHLDEMSRPMTDLSEEEKAMFKEPEDAKLLTVATAAPEIPFSSLPVTPPTEAKVFASPGVPAPAPGADLLASVPALQPYADAIILAQRDRGPDLARMADDAGRSFRRGDFVAAAHGYEEVLRWDRTNEHALCNLGIISLRVGRLDEAESFFSRALAKNPAHVPAHFYSGVLRFRQDRLDDALEAFEECVRLQPSHADAHNYLGLVSSRKGWGSRAESAFKKALDLNPSHAEASFNLAVHYATGASPSRDLAKKYYQRARDNGAPRDPAIERFLNG